MPNDQNETLMSILRGIWTPQPTNVEGYVRSDAPGTSERDILREGNSGGENVPKHARAPFIPDNWKRNRADGPGPSGTPGYRDRGDAVRLATRLNEKAHTTRARFPELATHGQPFSPPEFNILYDIFKTTEAYDKCVLFTAHGSFLANNTASTTPIVMDSASSVVGAQQSPLSHLQLLGQFPGALQMLPVLLLFTFGQSVNTATGEFSLTFVPQGGDVQYPLGEYFAGQASEFNTMRHVIKAPITDPGQTTLGTLVYTPNTVAGTTGTLFFRMGFGIAMLLPAPALKTVEPIHVGGWITASPEPPEQRTPNQVSAEAQGELERGTRAH